MTTIDGQGALHDALGQYTGTVRSRAAFDLESQADGDSYPGFAKETELSKKDFVAFGAGAALLGGLVAGCTTGDTPTSEPPATSPTSTSTLSPAPTDFASLDAGDLIPADQEDAAKAAGVGLVHLPQTDPDHAVVVTPGQELPEAVQDEIKATTDRSPSWTPPTN